MSLGGPVPSEASFARTPGVTPWQTLRGPQAVRPVSTTLLAFRSRPDGGLDEIYHEIPSFDGHKGAIFYISEIPAPGSKREPQVFQRIWYTMVPALAPTDFISGVLESFKSLSTANFESTFIGRFGGQVLIANSRDVGK